MSHSEMAKITITRSVDTTATTMEDFDVIRADYSEGLTLVDAMGMLCFALLNVGEDFRRNAEEAEDG